MQFRVKICGITNVADAMAAVEAGADAIGLNFFRGSRRCVSPVEARQVVDAVGEQVQCVGVFVNAPVGEIQDTCALSGLAIVQLHGDEPPSLLKQLYGGNRDDDLRIIRARRFNAEGLQAIREDIAQCRDAVGCGPDAILVDAAIPGSYGGTGHTADWIRIAGYREWLGELPLVLAGGLTPENVGEAIRTVQPDAVDVASGVESSPGRKDRAKLRDFLAAARAAFS